VGAIQLNMKSLLLQNRYRLLKLIGRSNGGRTFLAADEQGETELCVIKQWIAPSTASAPQWSSVAQFRQAVVRLSHVSQHPHLPTIFDAFEQNGHYYLVQAWIDGQNLEQELAEAGVFSEADVRQVLITVLPVLEFIHCHQIIHRDIKPANIIRRAQDGQLILVDFGAATETTQVALGATATPVGSAEYVAPEQVKGRASFASDLYSLGVTCIHLLTQLSPFDLLGDEGKNWRWRSYLPHPITVSLGQVLDKMLQPVTRWRYPSAIAVLADLDAASDIFLEEGWSEDNEIECDRDRAQDHPSESVSSEAIAPSHLAQRIPPHYSGMVFDPRTQYWHRIPKQAEMPSDIEIPDVEIPENFTWKIAAFLTSRRDAWGAPIPIWELPSSEQPTQFMLRRSPLWILGAIAAIVFGGLIAGLQPDQPDLTPASLDHSKPLQKTIHYPD
jgi:serine/threonine protein kinase